MKQSLALYGVHTRRRVAGRQYLDADWWWIQHGLGAKRLLDLVGSNQDYVRVLYSKISHNGLFIQNLVIWKISIEQLYDGYTPILMDAFWGRAHQSGPD